jgi:hypothetical protein
VVRMAALAVLSATALDLLVGSRLGLLFDVVLVLVCLVSALLVRPRDFFTVGVLPPLLLGVTVVALTFVDRAAVARADDAVPQAIVSGLAHHAVALSVGYALTLLVIALRQVALRNHGALRPRSLSAAARATAPPPPSEQADASASLPKQRAAAEDDASSPVR